jgi:hypothetical protein
MGRKLCRFFGGYIDYNDCDETECDKRWKKSRKNNPQEDGLWDKQNNRIASLVPISKEDINRSVRYAAYQGVE